MWAAVRAAGLFLTARLCYDVPTAHDMPRTSTAIPQSTPRSIASSCLAVETSACQSSPTVYPSCGSIVRSSLLDQYSSSTYNSCLFFEGLADGDLVGIIHMVVQPELDLADSASFCGPPWSLRFCEAPCGRLFSNSTAFS